MHECKPRSGGSASVKEAEAAGFSKLSMFEAGLLAREGGRARASTGGTATGDDADEDGGGGGGGGTGRSRGRAVQVDSIKTRVESAYGFSA
jgi:hypothetical protein